MLLLLQGDRVVVHTFGDGDWKAVLDHLREHQLIDAHNAPLEGPGRPEVGRPVREAASARERLETALRLWEDGQPLGHSLSARHGRIRGWTGDLPSPHALRHHGEVWSRSIVWDGWGAGMSGPTAPGRTAARERGKEGSGRVRQGQDDPSPSAGA